jgi:hypothetical protein
MNHGFSEEAAKRLSLSVFQPCQSVAHPNNHG